MGRLQFLRGPKKGLATGEDSIATHSRQAELSRCLFFKQHFGQPALLSGAQFGRTEFDCTRRKPLKVALTAASLKVKLSLTSVPFLLSNPAA